MIQRSFHLCSEQTEFVEHFKARYDAKDKAMFSNTNLRFDIDDELDAIRKKRTFVREVSKSHNF